MSAKVQSAAGNRKTVNDPTLIDAATLEDQVAETVSSTSMLCAQLVSWVVGFRREADTALKLLGTINTHHEIPA